MKLTSVWLCHRCFRDCTAVHSLPMLLFPGQVVCVEMACRHCGALASMTFNAGEMMGRDGHSLSMTTGGRG